MAELNYEDMADAPEAEAPRRWAQAATAWAGAITSVALVAGLAIWGYRLTVRDVSGVPVVRAIEGPLRVAPDDPGGTQTAHQGLAVNRVAAEGTAAPPPDQLILAPRPVSLTQEDAASDLLKRQPELTEAPAITPPPVDDPVAAALALVDEITAGETPLSPLPLEEEPATQAALEAPGAAPVPAAEPLIPGVTVSVVPRARPAVPVAKPAAPEAAPAPAQLAAIPTGTNLVQLGAFDSEEVARAEWQRLSGRFGSLMEGKQRVVQSAVSGGRTFYRLRAVGFADLADARRFCAALTAEKAECIPVVAK